MSISSLFQYISDPYERKARLVPGLLVVLPVIVPVVLLLGPKHPYLSALLALLGGCGVMLALARVARSLGKRKEDQLIRKWGGLPTTLILRHRTRHLDPITTRRYHDAITAATGIPMPTPEEEQANPVAADDAYRAGATRLRELTRGSSFALLAKENANYGFQRNMQGLRPMAVLTCLAVVAYIAFSLGALSLTPPRFNPTVLASMNASHGLSVLVSAGLLVAWLTVFTEGATRSAGNAYAERLLEAAATFSSEKASPRKSAQRGAKSGKKASA